MSSRRIVAAVMAAGATAGVAATAAAATKSIEVGDNYFVRDAGGATVRIKKGDTLKWKWQGRNPHNVTVRSGPVSFHSATMHHGASYSHRFTRTGTYVIFCTVHGPKMSMRVVVR